MVNFPTLTWQLPDWIDDFSKCYSPTQDERAQLQFAIELSRLNVEYETGGPFGAAIFERETGLLVAPGVNLVVPMQSSLAHAEMVAIAIAQLVRNTFDLSQRESLTLVSSTEPCAMCYGAIPWSGVSRLVYGATAADAEAIGFDEGCKPENWRRALERRGVITAGPLDRERAAKVLGTYGSELKPVYNPSRQQGTRVVMGQ